MRLIKMEGDLTIFECPLTGETFQEVAEKLEKIIHQLVKEKTINGKTVGSVEINYCKGKKSAIVKIFTE